MCRLWGMLGEAISWGVGVGGSALLGFLASVYLRPHSVPRGDL